MQSSWLLLGILILAELIVFPKIPAALVRGEVPLNPLGWFGYGELQQIVVDREGFPIAYWLIVCVMTAMAAFLGLFIYAVLFRAAG